MSDTTLRARRDEWIAAGVFDQLKSEALAAFDRIIGLDLSEVSVDGSLHKAPYGGEDTGPNPTDRGRLGWKWSVASDRHGVPIGWTIDGANRNDVRMLVPTLDAIAAPGCSSTSTPCTLTAATTTRRCASGSPSTNVTIRAAVPRIAGLASTHSCRTRPLLKPSLGKRKHLRGACRGSSTEEQAPRAPPKPDGTSTTSR